MPIPTVPVVTGPAPLIDRVRETSTTTGTGTLTLLGAVLGYQSFAAVGNSNPCYYALADPVNGDWEVGIGTYTAAGTTLSRTTILGSSNGGAVVSLATGIRDVWLDEPASIAINGLFGGTAAVTVANTTGETTLLPTGIGVNGFPVALFIPGKSGEITFVGYWSTHASSPGTLTLNFKLGGTTVATTGAVSVPASLTDLYWECRVRVACYTAGLTGTLSVQGRFLAESTSNASFIAGMINTSTTTYDTTVAQKVDLTATWSSAQTDNSITNANTSYVPVN